MLLWHIFDVLKLLYSKCTNMLLHFVISEVWEVKLIVSTNVNLTFSNS